MRSSASPTRCGPILPRATSRRRYRISMVAIVDTARPLARADSRIDRGTDAPVRSAGALRQRTVSALVLAPIGLAAAWWGPPLLSVVVAVAAGLMAWEWGRLCRTRREGDTPIIAAIVVVLVGAGMLWIALPSIALIWLALDPRAGWATTLWILAVVWATDTGAFAAGRTFGGPRLAPRFSPNKTWSGLLGGVVCAAAVGAVTGLLVASPHVGALALLSGLLAVVAQMGDLAESIAKRHFGVKDSSGLIPGHGGLLDRLDGMLTVIPAVALLTLCGGEGVLTWR